MARVTASPVASSAPSPSEPPPNCSLCPRLVDYRMLQRRLHPTWHNAPVRSFGDGGAQLAIVGLAPGVTGANRTGRPFTGDHAGILLYETLLAYGFAAGAYGADPADGLQLVDCIVTNAVRCVPPENKPTPKEISTCRPFLVSRLADLPGLRVVLALGRVAHDQTLAALGLGKAAYPFRHGARHQVTARLALYDSFHCSRYNTSTRKLTPAMFRAVVAAIRQELTPGDQIPASIRPPPPLLTLSSDDDVV